MLNYFLFFASAAFARYYRRDDDECSNDNDYDGRLGLRISAIFVILAASVLGTITPIALKKWRFGFTPNKYVLLLFKYFGSGVIIATAFIHLLDPAIEALEYSPCLSGTWTVYPWAEALCLLSIMVMFYIEFMLLRYASFKNFTGEADVNEVLTFGHDHPREGVPDSQLQETGQDESSQPIIKESFDNEAGDNSSLIEYTARVGEVFILEFGVIFHSVFIGLTLAVSGDEFITLYIVLVFHQGFEGLGLGSRLAEIDWKARPWTPYFMALGYAVTTPIAIAIGLGVRHSYPPDGRTATITNGIFDSISAGILIYTGLIELLAHDFLFTDYFRKAPIPTMNENLLQRLPKQLYNFFVKYPPRTIKNPPYSVKPGVSCFSEEMNPFLPSKHPESGHWRAPVYSRRRQVQLYRLAEKFNMADLLPLRKDGVPVIPSERVNRPMKGLLRFKGNKAERAREDRQKKIEEGLQRTKEIFEKNVGRNRRRERLKPTWF
ncbi:hypothetical protein CANCADRAFT_2490 [Tortispora caseinolytica NRRL Y-17796]|uniref:Large ribosomal subunit protein mL59 domain-containing protein n=1 Tax=Tortispora caseinolytica NRRL Y-17796 TaxID=767744 RepID=A0A1E4TG56_9ASCO|nr:hypothetical protein CANCADRAFT_2490 [Tortispora caseinolytica NRRL Y-17796]